jgi:hypothetical protein
MLSLSPPVISRWMWGCSMPWMFSSILGLYPWARSIVPLLARKRVSRCCQCPLGSKVTDACEVALHNIPPTPIFLTHKCCRYNCTVDNSMQRKLAYNPVTKWVWELSMRSIWVHGTSTAMSAGWHWPSPSCRRWAGAKCSTAALCKVFTCRE